MSACHSKKEVYRALDLNSPFSYKTILFKIVHMLPNYLYNKSMSRILTVVYSD